MWFSRGASRLIGGGGKPLPIWQLTPSADVVRARHPFRRSNLQHHRRASTASSPQGSADTAVKITHHLSPVWNKQRRLTVLGRPLCSMSLSEAAGHLSFIFLGLGYLETDLLPLRIYAAGGISCSIAFQYFRPQPLWIPISWNTIFLGINAGMVAILLKEESDARQQDKDSASLYDQTFRETGLTAVEFMKIKGISGATKRPAGEFLARDGVRQKRLYLVMDGELQVSKHGQKIATVGPGEFAGEISFLRHTRRECDGAPDGCDCLAVADLIVQPEGAKVTWWDFDELRELLANHPNMSVCFHAALARVMTAKLVDTHNPAIKYRQMLKGVLVDGVVTHTEKEELRKMRQMMKMDDEAHAQELKAAGWSTHEFDQGFHDVRSCREYEALVRRLLREGTIGDEGRTVLRKYRMANGIDSLHHMRVLKKLGWTLDDLEEGRRIKPLTQGTKKVVGEEHAIERKTTAHQLGEVLGVSRATASAKK